MSRYGRDAERNGIGERRRPRADGFPVEMIADRSLLGVPGFDQRDARELASAIVVAQPESRGGDRVRASGKLYWAGDGVN